MAVSKKKVVKKSVAKKATKKVAKKAVKKTAKKIVVKKPTSIDLKFSKKKVEILSVVISDRLEIAKEEEIAFLVALDKKLKRFLK